MSNAIPERRMRFNCSEGTLNVELYKGVLSYKLLNEDFVREVSIKGDGHGGGDNLIMKELFDCMKNSTLPKCSGNEGLESAVFALSIDNSITQNKVIDLEPIWAKLNR